MDTYPTSAGRAKTALVFGTGSEAAAVISTVVARTIDVQDGERVRFIGPVTFKPDAANHIREIVVPVADRILAALSLPCRDFEISVVNVGAASTVDLGISVSGFSADLPVLLALLSAGLQIPVPEDVVSTGHVASADGDIAAVKAIPAKVAASIAEGAIHRFVYPSHTSDQSLNTLTPTELLRIEEAVLLPGDKIRATGVADVAELVCAVFDEEAIALASLRMGFYSASPRQVDAACATGRAAGYLLQGNDSRFWTALGRCLIAGENGAARDLLRAWATFHVCKEAYPVGFGRRLLQLVRSLPPPVRRLKTLFPLLPMSDCIALSQFAAAADHEDVPLLHDAALGRNTTSRPPVATHGDSVGTDPGGDGATALDVVLGEIDPMYLARAIGSPIDSARATYTLDSATVASYDDFSDVVVAFYLHLMRYTGSVLAQVDQRVVANDAHELLEHALSRFGGFEAAFAEARDGTRGGMRFVLDTMTDQYKFEEQTKHVNRVLTEALDPLDWNAREAFMAAFLKRLGPALPPDIRSQPPERFARHYEVIAKTYARSFDKVTALLRTL